MYNRFIFVLVSVYLTLNDGAPTNNNQQSEQIKLFEDESDINELMGFPQGFFGVNSEGSPFLVQSGSTSNIADAFQNLRDELYMNDTFFRYKEYFGKAYKDTEEDERKSILQENIKHIFEHNIDARLKNQKYAMGINQFSDMTFEEFSQELLLPLDKVNQNNTFKKASLRESEPATEGILHSQVPQCKDWTEFDTPVKHQGICGSCWAFSTLAVIENHLKKNGYVEDIDLSEQELVDCSKSYGSAGCKGSLSLYEPFNYVKDRYISHEVHYKYKPKEDQCQRQSWCNGKIANLYMSDFKCQLLGENQIRDTVASVGTIVAVVHVGTGFQGYKSGIYDEGECKAKDEAKARLHAVAISGYCEDYWIIKNSWGVGWGEKGYMKLKRGKNICGIGNFESCYPQIIENPSQDRMKKLEDTIKDLEKQFSDKSDLKERKIKEIEKQMKDKSDLYERKIKEMSQPISGLSECRFGLGFIFTEDYLCWIGIGKLIFQYDGNLVIYKSEVSIWHTDTAGKGESAVFQYDGNFVIYDKAGIPIWHSDTAGKGRTLVFGNDYKLYIYDNANHYVWSS